MLTTNAGVFMGNTLIKRTSQIGGSKFVFVALGGSTNFQPMPIGGKIVNPFFGKMYAGDLVEYAIPTNASTDGATIKLLKTYTVDDTVESTGTVIKIKKNGFTHRPVVGEFLMKAPSKLTDKGAGYAITAVAETESQYEVTVATTLGALAKGDILVNAAQSGASVNMLVTNPNAVLDCDYDMLYNPSDPDGVANYLITPVLHGVMWECRMSALPNCVKAINKSKVTGWFEI